MALLGTFWNVISATIAPNTGNAPAGVYGANFHSLPTTPEVVIPVLRSVQVTQGNPPINLLALGGNPTYATVGYVFGSCATTPTVAMNIYAAMVHSTIR